MGLLSVELGEIKDLGVDLSLLGFSEEDLSKVFEDVKQGQTDPDNVPAPMDEAFAVKGEVYQLGDHRLMCGDSWLRGRRGPRSWPAR